MRHIVKQELSPEERFAVELAYGSFGALLDDQAIRTEPLGWVLTDEFTEIAEDVPDSAGSLRSRLNEVIKKLDLPITLSKISASLPEWSTDEIYEEVKRSFDGEFEGEVLCRAPGLRPSTRYIFILRTARHALHCNEIRAKNFELFGKDDSIHQIGSCLGRLDEALIVDRGTYDLYENINLTSVDLQFIREKVRSFLSHRKKYISTKIIINELFKGASASYGSMFGPTMLLGILQDDERFDVRHGMMVGLAEFRTELGFTPLQDEIVEVVYESAHPVSVREVSEHFEGRRDVLYGTIANVLESAPGVVTVGRARYDAISRAIGTEERRESLVNACALALLGAPRSALALSEAIEGGWGSIEPRPLKSFLAKDAHFSVDGELIALHSCPRVVTNYLAALAAIEHESPEVLTSDEDLSNLLRVKGAPDLVKIDPRRKARGVHATSEGSDFLDKLLGDFGV